MCDPYATDRRRRNAPARAGRTSVPSSRVFPRAHHWHLACLAQHGTYGSDEAPVIAAAASRRYDQSARSRPFQQIRWPTAGALSTRARACARRIRGHPSCQRRSSFGSGTGQDSVSAETCEIAADAGVAAWVAARADLLPQHRGIGAACVPPFPQVRLVAVQDPGTAARWWRCRATARPAASPRLAAGPGLHPDRPACREDLPSQREQGKPDQGSQPSGLDAAFSLLALSAVSRMRRTISS
jgi:hypothetical protein